jgi:MerR family transcriptional regulator, redox-sensitive transcriptional activator SoxR
MDQTLLSIGEVARRSGVAASALRFYEAERLIASVRSGGGRRHFTRDTLRRVAFIRIAQRVGLSLDEIRTALATLPAQRTPTPADWSRLSRSWKPRLDAQIAMLVRLRDRLTSCIGCGCLSFGVCALYNGGDAAAALGAGPRYLLGDTPDDLAKPPRGAALRANPASPAPRERSGRPARGRGRSASRPAG